MFKADKRFIAGAVCPRCNQMDKLVVFNEDGKDFRACVSCDFREQMHIQGAPRELETRVNLSSEERQIGVQTVKLVDPKK